MEPYTRNRHANYTVLYQLTSILYCLDLIKWETAKQILGGYVTITNVK